MNGIRDQRSGAYVHMPNVRVEEWYCKKKRRHTTFINIKKALEACKEPQPHLFKLPEMLVTLEKRGEDQEKMQAVKKADELGELGQKAGGHAVALEEGVKSFLSESEEFRTAVLTGGRDGRVLRQLQLVHAVYTVYGLIEITVDARKHQNLYQICVKNEIKCADAFRMLTVAYGEATLDRSNVYR
ncbi:hypothetical protein LAZ67_16000214 [Cordylochernes scorpioides]|uniref:Uncharacterized protein n=1 Tax=Cordylochernes scorpioides TaxID=51811 RepID=A0ABY6LAG8_9ARAC|nr:hypothetical protein LAZ67_16000214 [Cordylochernes scorpioides]